MAGHSKWATIHRKKGLLDAKRGKIFQKLAKEIYVAAKGTNGDTTTNANLRAVVEKAKGANMPKDNILSAIEKATKSGSSDSYDTVRYEGYGPGGVAIMVDCLTDNRNRTAGFVRTAFTHNGGNLGTDGSVAYLFERKGVIGVEKTISEDDLMLAALDAGAEDIIVNDDSFIIYTKPEVFFKVKEVVESLGISEFLVSEITYVAANDIEADDETKEKVLKLVDALEDIDDVGDVYYNLK